jgi:hypothetical protein
VQGDPRSWHGKYLVPGQPQERYDGATARSPLKFLFPTDDPLIKTVALMRPRAMPDRGWRLEKIEQIDLPAKPPPGQGTKTR